MVALLRIGSTGIMQPIPIVASFRLLREAKDHRGFNVLTCQAHLEVNSANDLIHEVHGLAACIPAAISTEYFGGAVLAGVVDLLRSVPMRGRNPCGLIAAESWSDLPVLTDAAKARATAVRRLQKLELWDFSNQSLYESYFLVGVRGQRGRVTVNCIHVGAIAGLDEDRVFTSSHRLSQPSTRRTLELVVGKKLEAPTELLAIRRVPVRPLESDISPKVFRIIPCWYASRASAVRGIFTHREIDHRIRSLRA